MDAPPGPVAGPDIADDACGPGVVIGVVGHDIHVVANRILTIGLAEEGFRPYNLGTSIDIVDFADAAWETGARAVLVASINGEGEGACAGFGAHFAAVGLADVLLYAGGNLVMGDRSSADVERLFTGYGFHRVFHQPPNFRPMFDALKRDLSDVRC
ncbi:glutamate mutase sigma subunit [Micromonospora sonchi]|uniref:Glutamate mutase sigma subunit n=1 Tax=Micromonospora sonchi TaxID=1763543 RepID=A0A917WW07_9ACTN|nr:methylaspartate mutase subunit S [Micromonospora sonchi]GGM34115.1 glutamate mutase sigma subunit [Micromonospora sonchi]